MQCQLIDFFDKLSIPAFLSCIDEQAREHKQDGNPLLREQWTAMPQDRQQNVEELPCCAYEGIHK